MLSLFTWLPRARARYQLIENPPIEMADRTEIVHEQGRKDPVDTTRHSRDLAGGDPDAASLSEQDNRRLPNYRFDRDSLSTLRAMDKEPDDVTEEELATLRRVSDKIPLSAWFVVIVELCERFTFYGLSPPFQNYIQYGPNDDPKGYLGLGQRGATGLGNFFQFWCYVTPILGAIVADQYLGRYRTIIVFAIIYAIGQLILVCTSIPSANTATHTAGLIAAMIVIGLGTGGIKSNVSALIVEQYTNTKRYIKVLKNGERVIVDPTVTIQKMYTWFYWAINIGGLSSLATTQLEAHVDFWAAYLLPFCVFFLAIIVLILGRKKYVTRPPRGSVVLYAFKVLWIGFRNKFNLDVAKPSYQESAGGRKYKTHWNDLFVDEIRRALVACRIFVFFPIYWVCYNQILNNLISQAGEMERHGVPNDFLQNIDPLTLIFFIPIMDLLVYPALRKVGIHFRPITRIFFGFMFASAAMAFSAGIQHWIYSSPPCYDFSTCDTNSTVNVGAQVPAYVLIGLSEIFASITGLEYAYTKAPPSMKSFVMSMFLLTSAFGSALGTALSSVSVDPKLVWMYTGISISAFVAGWVFWFSFKRYNAQEDKMDAMEQEDPQKSVHVDEVGEHRRDTLAGAEESEPVGEKAA